MKFTIQKKSLAEELQICSTVSEKKTTIPILGNIKLTAESDGLSIICTDLESAIYSKVEAQVEEVGSVCLPTQRFVSLCRTLPEGPVKIAVSDKLWASVTAGKTKARIAGTDPANFPEIPKRPDPVANLQARLFAGQIDLAKAAIASEAGRFTVNGFLMEVSDSVRCISTDGNRMVWTCGKVEESQSPLKTIVTKSVCVNLPKIIEGSAAGSRLEISMDDSHLYFAVENRLLVARKMAGTFPDYVRVLPKGPHPCVAIVNRKGMIEALHQVMNFSNSETKRVQIDARAGELAFSGESALEGACDTSIDSETSGVMSFGINGRYLLDSASSLFSEKVEMHGTDGRSAVEIRPHGESNYRCVIMPMR